jgi:GT2 family glycosyltransferase
MRDVAAVILNWRDPVATRACLASVRALAGPPARIVVVDNSGAWEAVGDAGGDVTVLRPGRNLGYAGGNNLGMGWAFAHGCQWALLLNDDVTLAADALQRLLEAAATHPDAGILGPLVLMQEEPGRILSAGGCFGPGLAAAQRGVGELDHGQFACVETVDFVSGCALLASRRVAESAGWLDERYFAYHEEVEWCRRAGRAGWRVLFVPGARVWHPDTRARDANSPLVTYYVARNALLFAQEQRLGWTVVARQALGYTRTVTSWSLRPKWRHKRAQRDALVRALADFARGRSGEAAWLR